MTKIKRILKLIEKSGDIFNPPRNKWIKIEPTNYKSELQDEFFDLISIAYKPIGGNAGIVKH